MDDFEQSVYGDLIGFAYKKIKESDNPVIQHFNNRVAEKDQEFLNSHPKFKKYSDGFCNLLGEYGQYVAGQRMGESQSDCYNGNFTQSQFENREQEYEAANRVCQNMSGTSAQSFWDFKG